MVAGELAKTRRDVRAIIYEKKDRGFKSYVKLFLFYILRKLKYLRFEDIGKKIGLTVMQADNINSKETIKSLKDFDPDILIVVGTKKLNSELFGIAKIGAINLHTGILPFYRGADSEFWALFNNDPFNIGITIHFIDENLDSGDILLSEYQKVKPGDTYKMLKSKNISLGITKLKEAISLIESGKYQRKKQLMAHEGLYRTPNEKERSALSKKQNQWRRRSSCVKSFSANSLEVCERVARNPLITFMDGLSIDYPRTFSLRIDADEYHRDNFANYANLFCEYKDAVTIFVCAEAFSEIRGDISYLYSRGIDIQSHGFYHHTYRDYASNRHNIQKAKTFFKDLKIDTIGFAAPMGHWNRGLMRALEDEGYEYSSNFSYDYLGLPSYPDMGKCISNILEIPIFPVCPELFLQKKIYSEKTVFNYYKSAIDMMESSAIPVVVYAHTSIFNEVPGLLRKILEYAIIEKGLKPVNMTRLCKLWKKDLSAAKGIEFKKRVLKAPENVFIGEKANIGFCETIKDSIKKFVDYETVTPDSELCTPAYKKIPKKFLRKTL